MGYFSKWMKGPKSIIVFKGHSEPASMSAQPRMNDKWSGNNFLLDFQFAN